MANSLNFPNVTAIYNRLLPAIRTKLDDLKKNNLTTGSEIDIWDYCLKNIWLKKDNLNIYDMVNDILFIDEIKFQEYLKERIKS